MRNDVTHGAKLKPAIASVSFLMNYAKYLQLTRKHMVKDDGKGKQTICSKAELRRKDKKKHCTM